MWETKIDPNKVFELRCKNTTYLGVGAIRKIDGILDYLKKQGISKLIVITGKRSYIASGAWDTVKSALDSKGFQYALYDKVGPNPTVDMIDEAASMGKGMGAQAVLAIGGGSPVDTGKSAAVLLEYGEKSGRDLYEQKFIPDKAKPIVAINLTHGTGTEVDRFAVATVPEKNHKPAIAYDCLYPIFAIDDPALMTGLGPRQTVAVSVDAVNHVVEAATTKVASPYTILTARETIRLVARYLPSALANPQNLTARYYLLYASALGGISFDNGLLHLTHALEHPLSALKPDVTHGLGLGSLLPSVIEAIYPSQPETLAYILEPIAPELKGVPGEVSLAKKKVERWLFSVGCDQKLGDFGFTEKDVGKLVDLAQTTPSLGLLLSLAPVTASGDLIRQIYTSSLKPAQ